MNKSTNNTEALYREIINKVIDTSKDDFENEGINEEVMLELKMIWIDKLNQTGIFQQNKFAGNNVPKIFYSNNNQPFYNNNMLQQNEEKNINNNNTNVSSNMRKSYSKV